MSNCRNLKSLVLSENKIRRIEGLQCLVNLEVLWLNDNKIAHLDGIPFLSKLKQFNVANNRIEQIGTGLDPLISLEDLNLSGNRIGNFKEILNLNRL